MDIDNNTPVNTVKTPAPIKVIRVLLFLKLAIITLTVILFWYTKDIDSSTRTALAGIKDGIANSFNLDAGDDTDYQLGRLIGTLFFPFLLTLLMFFSMKEKRFTAAVVFVSLDILFGLAQSIPLLSIIILVLLLIKSSRVYLKREKQVPDKPKNSI